MTGPAATSSSPDRPHPAAAAAIAAQGGSGSSGSGSTGGAGAGEGGGSSSPLVRSRPVTRSTAAMSSGRSTRQQQTTPADRLRHHHNQQQPTTPPPPAKGYSSTGAAAAKRGEASVNTPPPTAPPAATTSTKSPATDRSSASGQSNTTPTPTTGTQANTSRSGASHHYQTRHSYHPSDSSTHQQQQEPTRASGSSSQSNRKRSAAAASINTTVANTPIEDPRTERPSRATTITANTPATATSPTSYRGGFGSGSSSGGGPAGPELMCLCAREPKVPRPRNAFILYRQHHQQQTVAANPGTANPEISKIIGTQWKNEPEECKDQWRRLAEEEKLRHQQQFPDYKYQPRRSKASKGGDSAVSTPLSATFPSGASSLGDGEGQGPGKCPKCGGRYIATPRTPGTPFGGRFSGNTSGVPGAVAVAAMPSGGGAPPTPTQGGGGASGSGSWGEGAASRHRRGASMDIGPDYCRDRQGRQQQPPPPSYRYVPSAPGTTPYPHNYPPQHGGPGIGGGGYSAYPGPNERDRERDGMMINSRNWPPPATSGPPLAYDQPPPPLPFRDRLHDRLHDIRGADYEMSTPISASPSDAKRRRYNDGGYYLRQDDFPSPPPPAMVYGGPPPGGQGQYGYPPGPPPPLQSPHPRPSMHGALAASGAAALPSRSTPAMGPPPPPRGGSTTPVYHHQPDPRPHSGSGSSSRGGSGGGGGGRGTSHNNRDRDRDRGDAEFEQPLRLPPLQTHLPRQGQTSLPPTAASGGLMGSSSTTPIDLELSPATPTGMHLAGGLNISYAATGAQGSAVDPTLGAGNGGGRRPSLPGGSHVGASQAVLPGGASDPIPRISATARPTSGPSSAVGQPESSNSHKRPFAAITGGEQGPTGTETHEEKSALEAMIMSMHYLSKLTVLSEKIVCPLPLPHQQAGKSSNVRGPIIAIEGTNPTLMKAVASAVESALLGGNICRLKKWEGTDTAALAPPGFGTDKQTRAPTPTVRASGSSGASPAGKDVDMSDAPASSAAASASGAGDESRAGTKTPTPADSVPAPGSASASASGAVSGGSAATPGSRTSSVGSIHSLTSQHTQKSHHSHHSDHSTAAIQNNKPKNNPYVSYWTEMSLWHARSAEIIDFVTTPQTTSSSSSSSSVSPEQGHRKVLPVALLPRGYCLTYADRYACSTAIVDNYAPVDHWQWMATMWRGLVAADLTIYVLDEGSPYARDHAEEEDFGTAAAVAGGNQTVEFKRTNLTMAVMVVRLSESGGGLLEKTERRLKFEVLEWVMGPPFLAVSEGGIL